MAMYYIPGRGSDDNDGTTNLVEVLSPKSADIAPEADVEDAFFDDSVETICSSHRTPARSPSLAKKQSPKLSPKAALRAMSKVVMADKLTRGSRVSFRPKTDSMETPLSTSGPNRSSVFVEHNESMDEETMYSDLIDNPFGIDRSTSLAQSGNAGAGQEGETDPALEVLDAKLDMGLITIEEYNHMVSLHLAAKTLSPTGVAPSKEMANSKSHLSGAEKMIFDLTEEERLERLNAVRDGRIGIDEAVMPGSFRLRASSESNQPVLVGRVDVHQAVLSQGKLPSWIDSSMLRTEVATLIREKEAETCALAEALARTTSLEDTVATLKAQLERVTAEQATVERLKNSAVRQVLEAQTATEVAETKVATFARKNRGLEDALDAAKQCQAKLQSHQTQLEFNLESMRLRNKELQTSWNQAIYVREQLESQLHKFDQVESALKDAGVDIRFISDVAQEEKVRVAMAQFVNSAALRAIDDALEDTAVSVVIDKAWKRLAAGDSPLSVIVDLLGSEDLRTFGHRLAEADIFGEKLMLLAKEGKIDRALDRICSIAQATGGSKCAEAIFTMLGSPSSEDAFVSLLKGQELIDGIVELANSGVLGGPVQMAAQGGFLRSCLVQLQKYLCAGDFVGLLEQIEVLHTNGTLEMVKQFAGERSSVGIAASHAQGLVQDESAMSRLKGILRSSTDSSMDGNQKFESFILPKIVQLLPDKATDVLKSVHGLDSLTALLQDLRIRDGELDRLAESLMESTGTTVPQEVILASVKAIRAAHSGGSAPARDNSEHDGTIPSSQTSERGDITADSISEHNDLETVSDEVADCEFSEDEGPIVAEYPDCFD